MKHPVMLFIVLALALGLIAGFLTVQINSQHDYDAAVEAYDSTRTLYKLPITIDTILKMLSGDVDPDAPEANLQTPNEVPNTKDLVIYVDAGHGGNSAAGSSAGTKTGGTFGFDIRGADGNYLTERENNYYIALKVKEDLEQHGCQVVMSRNDPTTQNAIGNKERGVQAAKCDGAVIIHSNGAGGPGCFWIAQPGNADKYNKKITSTYLDGMRNTGSVVVNTSSNVHDGCMEKQTNLVSSYINSGGSYDRILYAEVGAHDSESEARYISSELGRTEIAKVLSSAMLAGITTKAHETQNPQEPPQEPSPAGNYPSWCVGLEGVDLNGAHTAYDFLKSKGVDDNYMQSNWNAIMHHYSLYGTSGW